MDLHGPYLPPRALLPRDYVRADFLSYFDFLRLSGRGELARRAPEVANLRDRYEAGMRLTDREVGALFDELRRQGRWDGALVMVVSDHGEDFGEHDHAGHSGSGLWASLVHVPWLLKPPSAAGLAPASIPEAVSTRSLLPTTLGLLGLPPLELAFAPDLTPRLRGGPPLASVPISAATDPGGIAYAATRLPYRRVRYFAGDGTERAALHHLERDPAETADASAELPEIAAELDAAIRAQRELEASFRFDVPQRAIDPATRARLKALGYAE
jgi:arylsulfatase A-like enzyme